MIIVCSHCLRFLQRARSLGFSVEDTHRQSADVKAIATAKLDEIVLSGRHDLH